MPLYKEREKEKGKEGWREEREEKERKKRRENIKVWKLYAFNWDFICGDKN